MNQVVFKGKVVAIMQDSNSDEEVLVVKNQIETVYIPSCEVGKSNAINYIGFELEYQHTKMIGNKIYASTRKVREAALVKLKESFENDPERIYQAKVLRVESNVAKVRLNHCIATIDRCDITEDPIPLSELIKVDDILSVHIKLIEKEFVQVALVEKRCFDGTFFQEDLQEGDLVYGVVSRKKVIRRVVDESLEKSDHTFVRVVRGIDALAPLQIHRPVEDGQEVVLKVNQSGEKGRIRGKVLRVLNNKPLKDIETYQTNTKQDLQIGEIVTGRVKLIREDFLLGKILILISKGQQIIVPFSELSSSDQARPDLNWMGAIMSVKVTAVEAGKIMGSKCVHDEEQRQNFVKNLESQPEAIYHAYVKEVGGVGYILKIGREDVYMLKADYRTIYETDEPLMVNDKVYVQLKSIQGEIVNVRPVKDAHHYELAKLGLTVDDFTQQSGYTIPVYEAKIIKLMKKGAYLEINDARVFLPNSLFSLEPTRVMDVYQVGDCIPVRIYKYIDKTIIVNVAKRVMKDPGLSFHELQPGMLAYGVVRKVNEKINKETGLLESNVYTSIGFKLDALSSKSQYFEIEEGDAVIFRINQVRPDGSIRGRIVRLFEQNARKGA